MVDGVNPKIVAERLGHTGVAITLDLYSHATTAMQQDAVDGLQRRLFSDSKSPS